MTGPKVPTLSRAELADMFDQLTKDPDGAEFVLGYFSGCIRDRVQVRADGVAIRTVDVEDALQGAAALVSRKQAGPRALGAQVAGQ